MSVQIYVTGGTFDKVYDPITEKLDFQETHIPEILRIGRNRNNVELETLMFKDSLYMTDSDRQYILEKCQSCPEKKILVSHGTGTMVETARKLGENDQSLEDKTVVLFGAMIPYSIKDTDAEFNFGFALGAVSSLPSGVYIAMNGTIFDWYNIEKNTELGHFKTIK
ncbi:MAG: asparaginase [Bacteroidetes bacterium]|nr:asparaginase [Bacteroidota bacterium]